MARGTCWIFATVAIMEHSYRAQGINSGYLESNEYLRLSEQVFGISVMDSCAALSHESCLIGDEVWVGNQLRPVDTQGGSTTLLYWLKRLETSAALPHSVCNYTEEAGHDYSCPGLHAALERSPLSFETRSITTLFDREDIKSALRRNRRVMSLSTGMVTIRYLQPCTKETSAALQCNPSDASACLACPYEPAFAGISCCVTASRESCTMGGEFYRLPPVSHPPPVFEGGHAMALVGYSDTFRTSHGYVGGYILRNSWWDGLPPSPEWKHARGSHSLAWFLQEISQQDEARLCPNAHAPSSWWSCSDLASCRDRKTVTFARAMSRPLHLECIDTSPFLHGLCTKQERFFLESIQSWGGGLSVGCFLRDDGRASPPSSNVSRGVVEQSRARFGGAAAGDAAGAAADADDPPTTAPSRVCSPPVPVEDLALVFAPVQDERYPNHPDLCGFYFFPYELAETISANSDASFEVDDFEIKWLESSYAANAHAHPDLDYSFVKTNTHRQEGIVRAVPFLRDE